MLNHPHQESWRSMKDEAREAQRRRDELHGQIAVGLCLVVVIFAALYLL